MTRHRMGLSAHSLNTKNSGRLDDTRCFFMGLSTGQKWIQRMNESLILLFYNYFLTVDDIETRLWSIEPLSLQVVDVL